MLVNRFVLFPSGIVGRLWETANADHFRRGLDPPPRPGLVSLERDSRSFATLHSGLYSGVPPGLGAPEAALRGLFRRTFGRRDTWGARISARSEPSEPRDRHKGVPSGLGAP